MCLRFPAPKMQALSGPPPTEGRVEQATSDQPASKQVVNKDDKVTTQYGSSKKEAGAAAGNLSGASSLKIPLNTPGERGSQSGGLNV